MREVQLREVVDIYDNLRRPLSTMARSVIQGEYPYYSANGIIDSINRFIFSGEYILVAEDGSVRTNDGKPILKLTKEDEQFWVSNHAHVLRAKDGILNKYLYYNLSQINVDQIITGAVQLKVSQENLLKLRVKLHSCTKQQHIVDTIGSIDSLIELNQEKIGKIKRLATRKYEFLYKTYPKSAIGKRLKFIKGKQPKFASKDDGLPYLIIDDLASNIYTRFSSEGLVCDENDVLMVMDGASSGKVFTGNKGYVGSTLAKLFSPQIKSSILYFGLSKFEEEIMKNTTGSAIPHTDKSFVSELQIIDDLEGKTTDFFNFCLNEICNLRTQNSLLNIQKEILLQKYFH